ncbi:hypothetical protein J008_00866 [Cryptococcus neoformans]|uniref:Uncharacterized protein n=2 Tax=Cryptococcus neoformans TaxID=5207 RepID=A0A854QKX4_CRYNE|nr:hypothetical protein CNAG_07388 [Cryptococcus neoformans var. grubii H99]AUB22473.1 hypothetical protein CKF44_07388 [Cryptococcus neoformans var. grubii]OWT38049.1 hypothetical protein C362_05076 [Cryptococcus neoformans var. grubii Bt1]OWZ35984.1 hypothetical protein C347_00948 [Cryptococcus neoformans var. grubii AD2-60a]OWZ47747.1 hypothetical protein C343_00875 [Cryptococcus neoformans var. grubii C23]OWZ54953.1 hypothetical protein C353_00877 [Cryptococcus neoformans var. grubii AD1-8|eukprot:XP_012047067.1 hypothetical protein CNAG_07388 [Cryptococcus neoformans var. grubii H99]
MHDRTLSLQWQKAYIKDRPTQATRSLSTTGTKLMHLIKLANTNSEVWKTFSAAESSRYLVPLTGFDVSPPSAFFSLLSAPYNRRSHVVCAYLGLSMSDIEDVKPVRASRSTSNCTFRDVLLSCRI